LHTTIGPLKVHNPPFVKSQSVLLFSEVSAGVGFHFWERFWESS
jgi:hypothetical protein